MPAAIERRGSGLDGGARGMCGRPTAVAGVLLLAGLFGCAHSPPPGAEGRRAPATQADPLPYAPPPHSAERDTRALVEDARALALELGRRVAETLVAGDGPGLRELFATRVTRTQTGRYALRERLLASCEREMERGMAQSAGLDAFVDLDGIQAVRATDDRPRAGIAREDYDYWVYVPLRPTHGAVGAPACLPSLFVRLRPRPLVVGVE